MTCERCGTIVLRRRRCRVCRRLCCNDCLSYPGSGMGRDGVVWCDKQRETLETPCVEPAA